MDSILGKEVKDKITGFKGIATGKAVYLYGCTQYCIVPKYKDGATRSSDWFDEGRIEIIGKGIDPKSVRTEVNGGPNPDAPKNVH